MGRRVRCVSRCRQNARILAAAMIVFSCHALVAPCLFGASAAVSAEPDTPEAVVRMLFQANAEKDLSTMEKLLTKDADMIGYTIGGRKFVRWNELARALQEEFDSVTRLEIPITDLHVWTRGDTAWYAMEANYIRYVGNGKDQTRTVLPLRETGVMERRDGRWVVVHWHESLQSPGLIGQQMADTLVDSGGSSSQLFSLHINLSGEWEIQEEGRAYRAMLDASGNGTYTWQDGRIVTVRAFERHWEGTWHQPGNDREGGFQILLSEDHITAQGVWWYTRFGDRTNIPPRQWGGTYTWKRLTPVQTVTQVP